MRALPMWCLVVVTGCSGAIGPADASLEDAGGPTDLDAGGTADAGTGTDAGGPFDGGAAIDAGEPGDAGALVDAGAPVDAGWRTVTFTPSTATIPNPERGFYTWASSDFGAQADPGTLDAAFNAGYRLVYTPILLGAYRTSALPQPFLTTLAAHFALLRQHGLKAVVRFMYDDTAGGDDAEATQIVSHLQQLAPVLAANEDALAFFQAGFIGAWGEWHSSKHSNSYGYMTNAGVTQAQADANRLLVRDALFAAVPQGVPLDFRYPGDLIKWFPSPTQQARAGLHNDCFLAGPSDTGTYASQAERTWVATLSEHASFGAETCDADTPLRTACSDIRTEGAQYHLAYLNHDYHPTFIASWTSGGCIDEVTRQLGYRLQLDAISHEEVLAEGDPLHVQLELRNVGWARLMRARPLVVQLRNGTQTIELSAGNLAELSAQATGGTQWATTATAQRGTWNVFLCAPDVFATTEADARFAVRFANADAGAQGWDEGSGCFATGTSVDVH